MDSRYECPICLNYLEEAVLTSCGHRFCMKCINMWLEQKGSSCPIDVSPLSQKDIFPDNFTRREIMQAKQLTAMKKNIPESKIENTDKNLETSMKSIDISQEKAFIGGDSCPGHDPLMAAMYERIILLEQRAHEQNILVENLRKKITMLEMREGPWIALEEELALRCCNGLFVWKITGFSRQLALMQEDQSNDRGAGLNPPQMLYSPRFYTHPTYGYRFCMRLNLSPRNPSYLSLVVHVVRGDFDAILQWPFTGRISLELVNQRDLLRGGGEHLQESVTVGGEGCPRAFSRPPPDGPRAVNPRGFGYMEFVALADLEAGGYLLNDALVIKVHVEHRSLKST